MSGNDKEMLNQFDVGRGRIPLLGLEKEMMNQFDIERDRIPQLHGIGKVVRHVGGRKRNVKPIQH